jgi:hypothetical protein
MVAPGGRLAKEEERRRILSKHHGSTISVKQSRSGSWYAARAGGALLGQGGRPTWFATAAEARNAVDELAFGSGVWGWVARNQKAA